MIASPHYADIVIIGTGMAGLTLAREVRKLNADLSLHFVTGDDGAVYSKPMISNAFAQGKSLKSLVQKSADQFGDDVNATIWIHSQVSAINRIDQAVIVDGPEGRNVIGYGSLILAVGLARALLWLKAAQHLFKLSTAWTIMSGGVTA